MQKGTPFIIQLLWNNVLQGQSCLVRDRLLFCSILNQLVVDAAQNHLRSGTALDFPILETLDELSARWSALRQPLAELCRRTLLCTQCTCPIRKGFVDGVAGLLTDL